MNLNKAVGAGLFVIVGGLLFAVGLFTIGERRMLFDSRFPVYTELASLGQLEVGAVVRVAGMDAGEVTAIAIPRSPAGRFRVRMEVREQLHPLVRTDSVATTQTEGLVGAIYVNIAAGSEAAPAVPESGTIPSREPFAISDLMQQASETVASINNTVATLSGQLEGALTEITGTVSDAHGLIEDVRPDITLMARNGGRISSDTQQILQTISEGRGTIGKLVNDDALYVQARDIAEQAGGILANVREMSQEAREMIARLRTTEGSAQGLMLDMRTTLGHAREATADLADNMEALKHNFLFRGFFNRRGYFDLNALSPAEYRAGLMQNSQRTAMRIWLDANVLFATAPGDGSELLTEPGRARVDSAVATFLRYLPGNPLVVEGYSDATGEGARYAEGLARATAVRAYLLDRFGLQPQGTGAIALGSEAPGSPAGERWDGVALTLFLDNAQVGTR